MAEKKINTRIALRIDTLANWSKIETEGQGANFVLKRGEIGLCEIPSESLTAQTAPTVLFKVGDGTTPFGELKWASALAADVYSWAKASDVVLDGKKIKFTGTNKEIDLEKFALSTDVASAVTTLEAADLALSNKITTIESLLGIGGGTSLATQIANAVKVEEDARKAADSELDGKITAAQTAADNAQGDINALEETVETLTSTVESNDSAVRSLISDETTARTNAINGINTKIGAVAEGKDVVTMISDAKSEVANSVTALADGQVKTNTDNISNIAKDYLKDADKQSLLGKIGENTTAIGTAKTELQGYADRIAAEEAGKVDTKLTNHINAYNTKVGELEGANSTLDNKISKEVSDREAADLALGERITTEITDRENAISGLQTQINGINNSIASGLHFVGVVEKLADVESPANGDVCIVGTQEYIYVESKSAWEPLGEAAAHANKTYVDEELAKKVDKTTYESKISALEEADRDIRSAFANADNNLKSELEGKINGKVAQGDFDTLEGRVDEHDTAIAGKVESSVYSAHVTAYEAKVAALEGKDTEISNKVSAIETSLSTGDIHNEINGVRTLATTAQNEVDALEDVVSGISTKLNTVEATANAAAVKETVDASISAINGSISDINDTIATLATSDDLSNVTSRVTTAEGKITTLEGKVSTLEETYTDAEVDSAISNAVAGETTLREAADLALSNRIKVFEDKFGEAEDILVFDCGSSTGWNTSN